MNVYFISGLGADKSIFKYIRLPQGYLTKYLDWIPPLEKESLRSYSIRMAENIDYTSPFALVGLSMGGMVAAEIAACSNPKHTVLISSIPGFEFLPAYYKAIGRTGAHHLIPSSFFQHAALFKRFFTAETTEDKKLLVDMIRRTDPRFIRWAINAILEWKSPAPQIPLTHIHGTRDNVLPIRYTKPSHIIERGDHLLVLTQHDRINHILSEVLSDHFVLNTGIEIE